MTKPKVGSKLTYAGADALGLAARIADPDITDNERYDSPALDMAPGTEVEVVGYDIDRELAIVEWTDREGNPRLTSIESLDLFTKGV